MLAKRSSMQGNLWSVLCLMQLVASALTDFHVPPPPARGVQRDLNIVMGEGVAQTNRKVPVAELEPQFWNDQANSELQKRLNTQVNKNRAKNVIFFLGDGMPISAITAARILHGQRVGYTGEEQILSFEKFPYSGLSRVSLQRDEV